MSLRLLNKDIKTEALECLGFSACGVVQPGCVDEDTAHFFHHWLNEGCHADMSYMEGHADKRLDTRLLMPEARSVICVALSYAQESDALGEYKLASYALGKDYHDVMKARLRELAEHLGLETYRVFCDTAPILEKYWAVRSGLGWVGRNHLLIIPKAGSMFFLGEIFTDAEVDVYDEPARQHCGAECRKCIDACPTGALKYDAPLDARRCLSYLTIENKGDIPDSAAEKMGDCFYGCDRCQQACPWNAVATPTSVEEFKPSDELLAMTPEAWHNLSVDDYRRLFKGSAVKRAKYEGLMRNISKMKKNRQ